MKRGTSQNPETRHCTGEAPPTEGSSTLGVPWAQQTLRQDWDPAAQRPSPNHPVPDVTKPRDAALHRRGGTRRPSAPGTHGVPWARQMLRQDWDPVGPATQPQPPCPCPLHLLTSICPAPHTQRPRHPDDTPTCSAHQQSCPGTDLDTRTTIRAARQLGKRSYTQTR